jgi:dipeptidyl-peptidase-4
VPPEAGGKVWYTVSMSTRSVRNTASVAAAVLALAVATLQGEQADGVRAALDAQLGRIFQSADYQVPRFGPARWLDDGTAYTTVERAPDRADTWDIVRYDAASGARSVLVAGSKLTPPGRSAALEIDDYQWSDDGRKLLVFTNTTRVWRLNTRGDYWVLDIGSGALRKLGGTAPESSLMFAKFSPDATRVAYVRGNNLYVEQVESGAVTPLTNDGSETTINGTSDWVNEEELGIRDGFRWSPDGTRIAYWQFDTSNVGIFSLINDTETLYPVVTRIPYPKAGTTNSAVRIGVVAASGGATKWMATPGDPRNTYLARLEWIDPQTLGIQQLNRLQNQNDFLLADARSGHVTRAFRDESKTWVEVVEQVKWLDGGTSFLWLSERDGWQHVFKIPRAGGAPTLVTNFHADVLDVAGFDEAAGFVYVIASPEKATDRYLYRARLDGSGKPERVTPDTAPGTHAYDLAPTGRLAFHTYSRFDQPPAVDVVELPSHKSLRALTDTSKLTAALAPALKPAVEFFTIDIGDGVTLDGWMLKPSTFDPARRYPVIVHVYGEPAGQTVTDRWGGGRMLFHRALAEAGYVVLSVDNRGTPAAKGAAWRKVIYGTVGDLSSKEQDSAIRALAARHAFIDTARIGVWGWSGGGSNTLNAMFRYPQTFKVGVSVAPVPDQRLYDTIYQERYMGLPTDNAAGYKIGSPINFAEGLAGKLLVVHGSGDDNVHYQGTEKLINRLIELGKPFDAMVYPNRTHAIAEGPGTTVHVYRLIARYFLDNLPAGPR